MWAGSKPLIWQLHWRSWGLSLWSSQAGEWYNCFFNVLILGPLQVTFYTSRKLPEWFGWKLIRTGVRQ